MKLIDCEDLLMSLSVDAFECPGCPEPDWLQEISDLFEVTEEDVVRCEDCKYYAEAKVKRNGEVIESAGICQRWGATGAEEHGFCAWGERG